MDDESTSRTSTDPIGVMPVAARPARSETWQRDVPTVVVLLVLAALVVLPFAHATSVRPAHDRMRRTAEPARTEVTKLHVALALQGSLVDDYIETRDSATVYRYREAVRQEQEATTRLAPLTEQLGATVRARFLEMGRLQMAWYDAAERGLAAAVAGSDRQRHPLEGEEYEDVLLAAARLDEAISAELQRTRADIVSAERRQGWVSLSLAVLGFVGAGAVAWLARRLQRHATVLEQQRAALAEATERRARLLRGISHDLKNPMHAIDGHAQLLEDHILGSLQPAQQDSVARIRRGVRSMLVLVEDLLELSRAEAGHLKVTVSSTDVTALLHEAVEEHRGAAHAAGLRLDLVIRDGTPPRVLTDAERARQVLGNLLSNAVKHTPAGGRVLVRAEGRTGEGTARLQPRVAIDVVDTGAGVPYERLESIFDEFSRLPVHADMPGSGLGLAIARRIARLLGGDVTAHCEAAGGARFTLWLPPEPAR